MKTLLIFFLSLIAGLSAKSQADKHQILKTPYKMEKAGIDSRFKLPRDTSSKAEPGSLAFKGGKVWIKKKAINLPGWEELGIGSDITAIVPNVATLRGISTTGMLDALLLGLNIKGDGKGGKFKWDAASTATDDGATAIKPYAIGSGSPGRFLKIFKGSTRAAEFNILSDGTSQSTKIENAIANTTVKELIIDEPGVSIAFNGKIDFRGKIISFKNGARFVPDGGGNDILINAIIDADYLKQVFDTSLKVLNLKNNVISASWFGADSTGATNSNNAFRKLAACVNSMSGADVYFPKGTYIVGQQVFAGVTGLGYSYQPSEVISISGCTKPVVFRMNGATIKMANGLKYGSFNPSTGAVYNPPNFPQTSFTNPDYAASLPNIFHFSNCASVVIEDGSIDGNLQNLIIGGYWGDLEGYQLVGSGISINNINFFKAINFNSRYNATDGIYVSNDCLNKSEPIKQVYLISSDFSGNTRQGLSWVGGNHLYAQNCKFNNTGKTVNAGKGTALRSAPGAGIDIEASPAYILGVLTNRINHNGTFENCEMINNWGAGMVSDGGPNSDCKFINCKLVGTTYWSCWPRAKNFQFINTLFVGAVVNPYSATSFSDPDRTKFINCRFSQKSNLSPTGAVHGNYNPDFGAADTYAELNNCVIESSATKGGPYTASTKTLYINCTFQHTSTVTAYAYGVFEGKTEMHVPISAIATSVESKIYGQFFYNSVQRTMNDVHVEGLRFTTKPAQGSTATTEATVTTTNATATTITTISTGRNERGILEVTLTGIKAANGDRIFGKKMCVYSNIDGKITLGKIQDVLTTKASRSISKASWTISTSGKYIVPQVKGVAASTIDWKISYLKTITTP